MARMWEMTDAQLELELLEVALSGENAVQLLQESHRRNLKVPPGVYNVDDIMMLDKAVDEN